MNASASAKCTRKHGAKGKQRLQGHLLQAGRNSSSSTRYKRPADDVGLPGYPRVPGSTLNRGARGPGRDGQQQRRRSQAHARLQPSMETANQERRLYEGIGNYRGASRLYSQSAVLVDWALIWGSCWAVVGPTKGQADDG